MSHKINRIRSVPPTPGTDCDAAFAIHFDDGPEPNMLVEYAAGAGQRFASESHARTVVATFYLEDDEPPRRLLVDMQGNVQPRELL
jgi:hypothetical protein